MKYRLDRSLSKLIFLQFFEYSYFYAGALFCLYMTHSIQSRLPFLAKELADIIEKSSSAIDIKEFFLLAIGIIVFRTGSRLLFFYPARVLQKHLRVEIVKRLEEAVPRRYQDFSKGQVYQIVSNDMDQLRALVGFALLQVGNIIIAVFVLVPKLSEYNHHLLIALSPMVGAFLLFTLIVLKNRHLYREVQDKQGEVQNFIIESYYGKKTIKNYHAEKSFINLFEESSLGELMSFYKAGVRVAFSIPLVPLGMGISLLWGAHIIYLYDLGASSLVLFSGFIFLFLEPLMFLQWIGIVFSRSTASWARIKELVKSLETEDPLEGFLKKNNTTGDQVVFNFWDNTEKITFEKTGGYAFVGETGCGKSEVLKQVADVFKIKGKTLSYVAQEAYLYNDTIEKNIFLGREVNDSDKKLALELLKIFNLSDLESSDEKLLNLEVGENGKNLSGGQIKRLAIVRSLMSNSDYLVWDDPFSSVDLIQEKSIFDELKRKELLEKRILVISTHRLTTLNYCDQVIFLEKNEAISEYGNRSTLLKEGSKTHAFFERQMV